MSPHLLYLTYGFPPASKSGTYRQRAVANAFRQRGWDVTVVGPQLLSYEWENGLDWSLLDACEPGVRFVEVPVVREDLDPDIRRWSLERVWNEARWRDEHIERTQSDFPEPYFGHWLDAFVDTAAREAHRKPPDLVMLSPSPYVLLGVALRLYEQLRTPYVIDYRDGWSLNTATGSVQFGLQSREGQVERDAFDKAAYCWFVNEAICDFYAQRFGQDHKYRVVRNGFDVADLAEIDLSRPSKPPLTFGYIGNLLLSRTQLRAVMRGWKLARGKSALLAHSELQLRGHLGTGAARGSDVRSQIIERHSTHGVRYRGPLARSALATAYGSFDCLLFMHHGHAYATSGKVYEYMGAGLPVVAAAPSDHGAQEILADYPLSVGPPSLDPDVLSEYFVAAAEKAVCVTQTERESAVSYARSFDRQRQLQPYVDELDSVYGKN